MAKAKMKVLYITPRWWKRWSMKRFLKKRKKDPKFNYIRCKKTYAVSVYDDGEDLQKEIISIDCGAILELKT